MHLLSSNAQDENHITKQDISSLYCGDSWLREQSAGVYQTSTPNSCLSVVSQAFLKLWTKSTTVTGLDYLMDALKEENREGRGVMTGKSTLPPNPRIIDAYQYRIISLCELDQPIYPQAPLKPCKNRVDEPLTWGTMPMSTFFTLRNTRWTLGARDILFTNP